MARALRPLRDEGILIIGTGNIVHNLGRMNWARQDCPPHDWAARFEDWIVQAVMAGDVEQVIEYEQLGDAALLSVPTPDHYWPLLYTVGVARDTDRVVCAPSHIEHGSLSMTSIAWWPE